MMTSHHDLSTILMAWGVLALCVWLTKHYTRLEYSNVLTSGNINIQYLAAYLAYRVGFIALIVACLASLAVSVGFSVGYFGTYYP